MRQSILALLFATLPLLSAHAADGTASASAAAKTPSSAPPQMEKLEEVSKDNNNALQLGKPAPERKITERKVNGKVVEAKVKSGKSQYVLKPNEPVGSAMRGDAQSNQVRGAQWQVMEFGGDEPKKKEEAASAPPPAVKK